MVPEPGPALRIGRYRRPARAGASAGVADDRPLRLRRLSPQARWITGQALAVDGGQSPGA
ncbi:hypothetical protein FZ025_11630 [Xanthomonas hyacinthi]|uniref:hypothetical protein n=1 Tax=Xanthomonas hyacinthi TaxID=56455 RepID=UPI0011B02D0F|nr:hypothetical protein FZ025_11630 [Xanthomonas hyacinthi]